MVGLLMEMPSTASQLGTFRLCQYRSMGAEGTKKHPEPRHAGLYLQIHTAASPRCTIV